jgi:hypothetical protein
MIVSEARIRANQANALKSTGPKTAAGKERSRVNALKHGLCSSVVVAEDARLVMGRTNDYFNTLRPQNDLHCWFVSKIALDSIKLDRCERIERRVRDVIMMKAELTWDDDRQLEAMQLGRTLGSRPDIVAGQLQKTVQGCEWMMTRWAMLAHVADVDQVWTAEQTTLAFDLLGTPPEFRAGRKPGTTLDLDGRVIEPAGDLASLARREIAVLRERQALLAPLDEAARALAMADLGDDTDPSLKNVRRYEATIHSRLRWMVRQLQHQSPFATPARGLKQTWLGNLEVINEPPPIPETPEPPLLPPEPPPIVLQPWDNPPFDLEPDEYPAVDQVADIPAIVASRREKKLKKAEARRDVRRRKVEKLRA